MDLSLETVARHVPLWPIQKKRDTETSTYRVNLIPDPPLLAAFYAYNPSPVVLNLLSEKSRTLLSEAVILPVAPVTDKLTIQTLTELSLTVVLRRKSLGPVIRQVEPYLKTLIAERMSVDIPLIQLLDVDSDTYWKRVFMMKGRNKNIMFDKSGRPAPNWKKLSIELKYREILEKTSPLKWYDDEMNDLAARVAPYISTMKIMHLVPVEEYKIKKDGNLRDYKLQNYPPELCHHNNLDVLGFLTNLEVLSFEFCPPNLTFSYAHKEFNFSYEDIENLAKGMQTLTLLKVFKFRRSRMDERKLSILVNVMTELPIEILEFSYCRLKDDCGYPLATLLARSTTYKSLELSGNFLSTLGIKTLMYGVQNYEGKLEYLGLARNMIFDDGIISLGRALVETDQVNKLDITGIQVTQRGATAIAKIVKKHSVLTHLVMVGVRFEELAGNLLVECLNKTTSVIYMDCRACDLTLDQLYKIKILVERNNYLVRNPLTRTDSRAQLITPEDFEYFEEWLQEEKHPILLKVRRKIEEDKHLPCRTLKGPLEEISEFPDFIPRIAKGFSPRMDLLNVIYPHEEVTDEASPEPVIPDPNNFNKVEFHEYMRVCKQDDDHIIVNPKL